MSISSDFLLEILSICQLHISLSRTPQTSLKLHFCVQLHSKKTWCDRLASSSVHCILIQYVACLSVSPANHLSYRIVSCRTVMNAPTIVCLLHYLRLQYCSSSSWNKVTSIFQIWIPTPCELILRRHSDQLINSLMTTRTPTTKQQKHDTKTTRTELSVENWLQWLRVKQCLG